MPDSIDVAEGAKKHFWRASGEVFGFNMGLWAFDRYVQKGDFGGSGVIPWQSYPKMIDKRYMKNGRSDTPCS